MVSAAGMRLAKVTANALNAGIHRMLHRACPVPLESSVTGPRSRGTQCPASPRAPSMSRPPRCGVDRVEVPGGLVPVLLRRVSEHAADQVNDADLQLDQGKHCVRRLRQAFESVADQDEHIRDATVLQLGRHAHRMLGRLAVPVGPTVRRRTTFPVDRPPGGGGECRDAAKAAPSGDEAAFAERVP